MTRKERVKKIAEEMRSKVTPSKKISAGDYMRGFVVISLIVKAVSEANIHWGGSEGAADEYLKNLGYLPLNAPTDSWEEEL